jgi:Fur family ferric uptake transcriptional regulator
MTKQKRAVAAALEGTDEFTSAQDLHARLRAGGETIGLATVYNQLRALSESGEVDSMRGATGETLYRRCAQASHHHHLVCRECGRAVEVDAPELEAWAQKVGRRHGFGELDHVLEITGVCDRCLAARPARSG